MLLLIELFIHYHYTVPIWTLWLPGPANNSCISWNLDFSWNSSCFGWVVTGGWWLCWKQLKYCCSTLTVLTNIWFFRSSQIFILTAPLYSGFKLLFIKDYVIAILGAAHFKIYSRISIGQSIIFNDSPWLADQ